MIPARGPQTKNLEFLVKAGQSLSWNRKVILWKLSKNSASVVRPLFGEQWKKVGKERTCQQVLRAKHLLTTSVFQFHCSCEPSLRERMYANACTEIGNLLKPFTGTGGSRLRLIE